MNDNYPTITPEDCFRPGEDVYIQLSGQFPEYLGVMHKHTFIELVYVISGSATHMVADRKSIATKGDVFIINYDTPHAFLANKDDSEPFVAYDLMFMPRFLDADLLNSLDMESIHSSFLFYSLFPSQQIGPDMHITGPSYNRFGALFKKCYDEYTNQENGYIDMIRAYLVEIIIFMFRKMGSSAQSITQSHQEQIVNTTLDYLHKNYQKHISLNELAAQVFLSKDYFSRLFREITGMPINSLLQEIRINEACNLLTSTDRRINDIAVDCGFSDINYFHTVFKKLTGLTPRQYRENKPV